MLATLSRRHAADPTRRQRGFTLIELMVILVIIGTLAALIVPNVLDRADEARTTAARTDVNNLMQALKLYRLDNQRYPSTEQGLQALVTQPTSGSQAPKWRPYLDKLPTDPWAVRTNTSIRACMARWMCCRWVQTVNPAGMATLPDVGSWQ